MLVVVWLASGAFFILGGWQVAKVDHIVRPMVPTMTEENFRISAWYYVWNLEIPDTARRHAILGYSLLSTSMILASFGIWQAGQPALSVIMICGTTLAILEIVSKYQKFKRERRSRSR